MTSRFTSSPYGFRKDACLEAELGCWIGSCVRFGRAASRPAAADVCEELVVLDIVYVFGGIALFVVVGLLGKAVEKL
ncbi:hypothetical protein [Leucobacter sp. wl10]|uniref:hypothetical protein n=1 Tax=Leucobacter sp. wl10 TaxID=2304677 RepID=UPI000E5A4BAC|nr:hypothetical protein [Leucobacter sp. wl10]RGE18524.1 hypothetical protein D1J51_14600 [Leucobacter sp. wl10]